MSRIPRKADVYAEEELVRHMSGQMGYLGVSTSILAQTAGITPQTVLNHKKTPGNIPAKALRAYIKKLNLDPVRVLVFLGYTTKEAVSAVKKYAVGNQMEPTTSGMELDGICNTPERKGGGQYGIHGG